MSLIAIYTHSQWHNLDHLLAYIILAALIILAFEVWMLVDCIKNEHVPLSQKVWWIVGMFLVHPFVAIAFYFASRYHYKKLKNQK